MARVCRLWSCGAGAARRWPQHAWSAHARPHGRCVAPPIYYARAAATAASKEPAKRHDGAAAGSGAAVAEAKAEAKASPASLAQLWSVLRPERRRLQLAVGALCASSSVNLSYPYLMGRLVDVFGSSADGLAFVLDHVFTCGGAICIGGIATFCRLYLIETSIERVSYRLRREFFSALLQRDIAFFDKNKTGELVNRLGNDITVTSRVLIDCSAGIRSIITACVGTFMVFKLAPTEMMVTLLAPVAGLFVLGVGYGRLVRRISERRQERLAEAVQLAEERLSGIRTVRTFNAEASELRSFEHRLESVYAAGRQNALASGGLSCLFVTGGGLFLLHIVYNCGMLVTSGVVSIGSTMSLAMYCFMAGSSYTGIMTAYGDIQKGLGACQKVLSILNDEAAGREPSSVQLPAMPPAKLAADIGPAAVRFEDVGFAYPARPDMPVLRGLDLDIPAGARVAILGRSGSGKSTLAALLAGLYAPAAGRVLVDGLDLFAEPGRAAWARHQLGVIGQDPTLFTLTLRENVSYGLDGEEDDDERRSAVDDAVRAAHVSEFASTLPQGLDTPAGERGRALSGGQKQRVCIARALARRPRMLVFDEATSALDMRSEQLVHTALEEVLSSRSCTCLVITHRLSALRWTDRVAVIEEGRVAQYGPQEEVMAYPCPALRSIMRSDGDSAD